ncbi:hypothetical protein Kpho02_46180 [Kitasatospora phosalacinea]|uniref:Transposase IS4-like domain-containing protein n=1 Tax=Kitasatospora phosalacinea TaxID=2065 RepID=A0A9W6V1S1_9ACTN|nr:hypothetical protein Kpho02_46180 [Kitasatospora phosalacinea]
MAGRRSVRGPAGGCDPKTALLGRSRGGQTSKVHVAGDKAYSSRGHRAHLRKRHVKAVIPEKREQAANRKKKGSGGGRPVSHGTEPYKDRNTVERLINELKAWRGIATRSDKTPESHLAGLRLRGATIQIEDLTRTH